MTRTRNDVVTDDDIDVGLRVTLEIAAEIVHDAVLFNRDKYPGTIVAVERSDTGKIQWIDVRNEDSPTGAITRAWRDKRGRRVFYGGGHRAIIVDVHHAFTPDFADEEAA